MAQLRSKIVKTLPHHTDGFIFAPVRQPYVAGRQDNLLKWKPMEMNSIDFLLRVGKLTRPYAGL